MNKITASMLTHLMEFVTSKDFMSKTIELVNEAFDMTKTGAEKRQWVIDNLKEAVSTLGPAVAGYIINLAIESAVAYVNAHKQ